jgi:hypothetical protein
VAGSRAPSFTAPVSKGDLEGQDSSVPETTTRTDIRRVESSVGQMNSAPPEGHLRSWCTDEVRR